MKIFITFLLIWRLTESTPLPDDDPPADGDAPPPADPPADPPAETGGEAPAAPVDGAAAPPADGASSATTPESGPGNDTAAESTTTPGEAADNSTTAGNNTADNPDEKGKPETAVLTIGPDDEMPEHVATDKYGMGISTSSVLNIPLDECKVNVVTEMWVTRYTAPPTCMCLTRGPLPLFKLIGNLHFKYLKKTPKRITTTDDSTSTVCPPCDCNDCFTSERTTARKMTIC